MTDAELLVALDGLSDPTYGHIYVEFGGFETWRSVGWSEEGYWYYEDRQHGSRQFRVPTLKDALSCLVSPPSEGAWEDNLREQRQGEPKRKDEI